jgi:hypothetical protein
MRSIRITKLLAVLAGLIFLMGFNPAGAAVREKFEERFEKTVALPGGGEVILINISGAIAVKSWDRGEVKIDALKVSTAPSLSEAEENSKKVEIVVRKEGETLRIETEYPKESRIKRKKSLNVSVEYKLWIPSKASVKINSVSGSVSLEEIGGSVKVNVVSGNVAVSKADRGVDCETASGKVTIEDVSGDAYLKTLSGKISVERIRGSIEANVVSGSIEMREVSEARVVKGETVSGSVIYEGEIDPEGRYYLVTHSGRVEMMVPADSAFELEANTFSGRIESDFDITISGRIDKRQINGTVNKGGASVKLSTFSGNIILRKK